MNKIIINQEIVSNVSAFREPELFHVYVNLCYHAWKRIVLRETVAGYDYQNCDHINSSALKNRLQELCKDHEVLLHYTTVSWLSKNNGLIRGFELKYEIATSLMARGKVNFFINLNEQGWQMHFFDILEQLNSLNLGMQCEQTTLIQF